ncbi:hypothetical protein WJT86_09505 [Microvirga sp. W0021]|uniref:Uncharacterized protein n=1 Tax=Hohaiivirga grylli TaxID=3133970 RepID=A0ABV0BKR5_9HYPH
MKHIGQIIGQSDMRSTLTRRESLCWGFAGLFGIAAGVSATSAFSQSVLSNLKELFALLPDWSQASVKTPMTQSDLVNLKEVSVKFLEAVEQGRQEELESALQSYIEVADLPKMSGLYLLFHIIFDLPDIIGAPQWSFFGSWVSKQDATVVGSKKQEDDFHPSWPVYLARISNKLFINSNDNPQSVSEKSAYRIWDEYQYLKSKYKFRPSTYIAAVEFIFVANE